MFYTNNENIINLVISVSQGQYTFKQLMELAGLKDSKNFILYHLTPAIEQQFLKRLYPDKPNHPRQKYLLTIKGLARYNELKQTKP